MPLSEFLRMARGKIESSQQKPATNDFSARSENDLVELVWENGQILLQGQSSRASRSAILNNLSSITSRVRDARFGKFGGVESIINDMAPVVPSGDMDLSQDDEIAPWLSYPVDDTLGRDYVSETLPENSGVTANGMSIHTVDKRANNLQSGASNLKVSSFKDPLFGSWLPQNCQTSDALGSGVTDFGSNKSSNRLDAVFRNPAQSRDTVSGSASMMMERQSIPPPTNSSTFLNFSHFSNVVKSVHVEKFNSILKDINTDGSCMLPMANSREAVAKGPQGSSSREITENLCQETSNKIGMALHLGDNDNSAIGAPEEERTIEPMVASSSVGSGNSADRVSCEQTNHSKRKFRDIEESECRSDDLETESIDAKKPTHVRGSKRSRAAEVHNLSERRRRDRINEKMRALQELIPNCNKADKASMLDEAIEYLKTLQLQVQMMTVGSGLYVPPLMFPTGMQHMRPAHVPHFPPMGPGMGFGMGMPDMNVVSSGCPLFPVPPLQVPHFPYPMLGLANFQRMPGPNLPVFGHPGQALPNSAPRTAYVPLAPRPPLATSSMGSSALRNGNNSGLPSTSRITNPGDPVTTMNSQSTCSAEASCSDENKSNQLQPRNEVEDPSVALATDARGSAAHSSVTDINKKPGCD